MTRLASLSGSIAELKETIRLSLCVLNRMQFAAPWRPSGQGC